MIHTSESDDPSPTMLQRIHVLLGSRHVMAVNFIAALIVSCFLLVSHVRAQEKNEDAAQRGRNSLSATSVLCDANTFVQDDNALTQAMCAEQRQKKKEQIFAQNLREYVAGHPIEQMTEALAKEDPVVVAYMIAMAKQESNWGKRVPVFNGQDCYNYWGFRAKRARMGTGGHTCFDSPEDAVETVARRVHDLVYKYNRTTPRQMLVWKCGRSCATHDPAGVERWVTVVGKYYRAIEKIAKESAV